MALPTLAERRARLRQLLVLRHPRLWPHWPFLPVARRTRGAGECGVLYDARRVSGRYGYSATVFFTILFALPPTEAALLALPKEVYDTAEEVYAAGWRVD
ncbi:MAG TPA: hypothetical protein VGF55_13220 [Gemmataceae bacterium]|jgi:hypothetical protein